MEFEGLEGFIINTHNFTGICFETSVIAYSSLFENLNLLLSRAYIVRKEGIPFLCRKE